MVLRHFVYKLPTEQMLIVCKIATEAELHYHMYANDMPPVKWPVVWYKKVMFLDAMLFSRLHTEQEIAELTGFSRNAITWRIHQKSAFSLEQTKQQIYYLSETKKLAVSQIAIEVHMRAATVRKIIEAKGLTPNTVPVLVEHWENTLTDKQLAKIEGTDLKSRILAKHSEGLPTRRIAEAVGCSVIHVYQTLYDNKLKSNPAKVGRKPKQITRWQRYRREGFTIEDIILDSIRLGEFSNIAAGIENISIGMGIAKATLTPIVEKLLNATQD